MAPPGRRAAVATDLSSLRSLADQLGLKLAAKRRSPVTRASFDPVRVEAELYDALYGSRTGTVDNIVPVSGEVATLGQTSVAPADSAGSTQSARDGRLENAREALDAHPPDLRHAA
jgi:hypothetical protein